MINEYSHMIWVGINVLKSSYDWTLLKKNLHVVACWLAYYLFLNRCGLLWYAIDRSLYHLFLFLFSFFLKILSSAWMFFFGPLPRQIRKISGTPSMSSLNFIFLKLKMKNGIILFSWRVFFFQKDFILTALADWQKSLYYYGP